MFLWAVRAFGMTLCAADWTRAQFADAAIGNEGKEKQIELSFQLKTMIFFFHF